MKVSCILLLAMCLDAAEKPGANPYAGHPQEIKAGAKLYRRYCAACHESGDKAPPVSPGSTGMSEEDLFRLLKDGRLARGMPSWAQLPPDMRWQIVSWLRSVPH